MGQNKISGVYKITNNITGEFYIGSSKNIKKRWTNHKLISVWKRHPNVKLYKALAQYGRDNFTIEVIEETNNLREREQYYIEQLKPTYNDRHADGQDAERYKETRRRCSKEWCKIHRNEHLTKIKEHDNRICFYEGETLTLAALSNRFCRQGMPHPTLNAKKYLIERSL